METHYSNEEILNIQRLLLSDDKTNLALAFTIIQDESTLLFALRHTLTTLAIFHKDGMVQQKMKDWLIVIGQRPLLFDLAVFKAMYQIGRRTKIILMAKRFKTIFSTYAPIFQQKPTYISKIHYLAERLKFFQEYELSIFFYREILNLFPHQASYYYDYAKMLQQLSDPQAQEAAVFYQQKAQKLFNGKLRMDNF